jgi:hypothetical protein
MKNFMSVICVLLAILAIAVPESAAKKLSVFLGNTSLTSYEHADSARGDYYTLQIQVPQEIAGKRLYGAILEFTLDVSGAARDSVSVKIPVLEVYALESTFAGSLNGASVNTETGTIRNLAPGNGRRVRIDITEVVKTYINQPSKNYGLIIGGLAPYREGNISVKQNAYKSGNVARIDFHYDSRSGN